MTEGSNRKDLPMDSAHSLALPRHIASDPDAFYAAHGPAPWQRLAALLSRWQGRGFARVARRALPV